MDEDNNLSARHGKATLNVLKVEIKNEQNHQSYNDCISRGTDQNIIRR